MHHPLYRIQPIPWLNFHHHIGRHLDRRSSAAEHTPALADTAPAAGVAADASGAEVVYLGQPTLLAHRSDFPELNGP
jgi:hypothetical protein